jgi:hypothetical protein
MRNLSREIADGLWAKVRDLTRLVACGGFPVGPADVLSSRHIGRCSACYFSRLRLAEPGELVRVNRQAFMHMACQPGASGERRPYGCPRLSIFSPPPPAAVPKGLKTILSARSCAEAVNRAVTIGGAPEDWTSLSKPAPLRPALVPRSWSLSITMRSD